MTAATHAYHATFPMLGGGDGKGITNAIWLTVWVWASVVEAIVLVVYLIAVSELNGNDICVACFGTVILTMVWPFTVPVALCVGIVLGGRWLVHHPRLSKHEVCQRRIAELERDLNLLPMIELTPRGKAAVRSGKAAVGARREWNENRRR